MVAGLPSGEWCGCALVALRGRSSRRGFLLREATVMAPQSSRHGVTTTPRRPRSATFFRPRPEALEYRIVAALFDVHSPLSSTALNNNGCVAVADLNKDGFADAVLTNYGPSTSSSTGNSITVLKGQAGGVPSFGGNLITNGTNVSFAAIGDINGD